MANGSKFSGGKEGEWIKVQRKKGGNVNRFGRQLYKKIEYTIFVKNLPKEMDREWLNQIFGKYGRVHEVFIHH